MATVLNNPAGQAVTLPVTPNAELQFGFEPGAGTYTREDNNLVIAFEDGGRIVLTDFYAQSKEELPKFLIEDTPFTSEQFLAQFNDDSIMPAAGPAAAQQASPMGSGGTYSDDAGNLIGGIGRLGALGNNQWTRDTGLREGDLGLRSTAPAIGTPEFEINTDIPGPAAGAGRFIGGVFENGQADKHIGDHTISYGQINFSFTTSNNTVVDAIRLSGFSEGTTLYIGVPGQPGTTVIHITGEDQVVTFTQGQFTGNGVYLLPPTDYTDKDMSISAQVDMHNVNSGLTGTYNGSFIIVVDAVADRPEDITGTAEADNAAHSMSETTRTEEEKFERGYDETQYTVTAAPGEARVEVAFNVTATFFDYEDGSELHYVLVEQLPGFTGNYPTITGPDGVTYFQVPVSNAEIAANNGTVTVPVTLHTAQTTTDTDFSVRTGAMAEETPTDGELRLDNNVAYNFNEETVNFSVDVIDSTLTVTTGWASEGNAPDKNMASGEHIVDYNGLDIDSASTGDNGAPITLGLSTPSGSTEVIESVTFTYDGARGELVYNGLDGSVTQSTAADGTVTFTITGIDRADLNDLYFKPAESGPQSYNDADVILKYDVIVTNGVGAHATFSGSSTVVIDAVADLSTEVGAGVAGDEHHTDGVYNAADQNIKGTVENEITEQGWDHGEGTIDYSKGIVNNFSLSVNTQFFDYDDESETHYILIQNLGENWSVDGENLPTDWALVSSSFMQDGATYFVVQVPNSYLAEHGGIVDIGIPMEVVVTGDLAGEDGHLNVGSLAVEDGAVNPDGTITLNSGTGDSATDREYDLGNNVAVRIDDGAAASVDLINSTLTVDIGWASEGNNDAKHLPGGQSSGGYAIDPSNPAYQYAGATGNEADGKTNLGAPIEFQITGEQNSTEYIAGITIKNVDGEGNFVYKGQTLDPTGNFPLSIDNDTVTYDLVKGFTIEFGDKSADLGNNLYYRPSATSYSDADVHLEYSVTVKNDAGASATFDGTSTVVVDAVADMSTPVKADMGDDAENPNTLVITDTDDAKKVENDSDKHEITDKGWEIDTYSVDYSGVTRGFTVTVATSFPDHDGSERHYILLEKPADGNWELGDLPKGYTYTPGDDYKDSDGKIYFKIEVTDRTLENAEVPIPLNYNGGITGDLTLTLKSGSYVEETDGTGYEYDKGNNIAVRTDGTAVEYKIDVVNSTLTVKTGWASEGNNDAKHLGSASSGYNVSSSTDTTAIPYAESTANTTATGSTNAGAPIVLTLSGQAGSTESISTATFTFEASRGALFLNGKELTGVPNGDGTVTITLTGADCARLGTNGNGGLVFRPTDGSFDYSDVGLKYTVTVSNTVGSNVTFEGGSTIVIDAVADRPGATAAKDGTEVDYPVTKPYPDAEAKEQGSAKPGDTVKVHGTVTFPDTSGGEEHYILIEKPAGTGANNYALDSVTISYNGGFIILTAAQLAAMSTVSVTQSGVNGGSSATYYKVSVSDLDSGAGDKIPSFDVEITITVPATSGNNTNTVGFGGRAEVDGGDKSASGGDYEFDKGNNTSNSVSEVQVKVDIVDSKLEMQVVGVAYENAHWNAHEGFVSRDNLTTEQMKEGSAPITFSGLADNEVIAGLSVRFQCLDIPEILGGPASTGAFMYGDTLIPVPATDMVIGTGASEVTVNCSYDPDTGYITLTIIPSDGNYELTSELRFVPGESYRSDDIPLEFVAIVQDSSSTYTKPFYNGNGNEMLDDLCDALNIAPNNDNQISQTPGIAPDTTVIVDAVAQQAAIDDVTVTGREEYTHVVPGEKATVHMDVDVRGDVLDSSESHYFYVEAKQGLSIDHITIKYLGIDGEFHTVTIPGSDLSLQPFGTTMYNACDLRLDALTPPAANGKLTIDLVLNTPTGMTDGTSETLKVGILTQEEYNLVNNPVDQEYRLDNNQSTVWKDDVTINFSSCTKPGIGVGGAFYENSTANAHKGDLTHGGAVPISFSTGDSNDALIDFRLALDTDSKELGDLYLFESAQDYQAYLNDVANGMDPYDALVQHNAVNMGNEITLANIANLFGTDAKGKLTGDFSGQIVFVPGAETYSGVDPKLDYTIKVQDTDSGQIQTTDSNSPADGQLSITADSVAQLPEDLVINADGKATLPLGGEREVTVSAIFADLDGSTEHYILVEAKAGWIITVDGKEYGPGDIVIFEEGGKSYYKIPVSLADISAGHAPGHVGDDNYGTASVNVKLTAPTDDIFYHTLNDGKYSFEVKAGSTDSAQGDELTFHNNTAVIEGGSITGNLIHEHNGTWIFEQTAPLYEDNMPYKYLGQDSDKFKTGGEFAGAGPDTTRGGMYTIGCAGKQSAIIEVLCDGSGNPLLDITGPGVTYQGDGKYLVNLTVAGAGQIVVALSEAYLKGDGAYNDADITFTSVTFYQSPNGHGNSISVPSTHSDLTVMVDAVADYTPVKVNVAEEAGKGNTDIHDDAVVGNIAGEKGGDETARFTVHAEFKDTDGSETHYVLVEKVPSWTADTSTYKVDEVYIDGKTYYRFDVTVAANKGETDFTIGMVYQGGGANKGDDIFGSDPDKGVTAYNLQVGSMSQESAPTDKEFTLDNNIAVNLGGEVTLLYSPIDSTGSMHMSHDVISEGGKTVVTLTLTGIATDKSDMLTELTINYTQSEGQLYLVDDQGNRTAIDTGHSVFTAEQLLGLSERKWHFEFEPNQFTHNDVSFSWTGTVTDTVSGAFDDTIGGSELLIIDAVADGSNNVITVVYDSDGHTAALNGQPVDVIIKADFIDNVNTSEQHWVVLQQADLRYGVTGVEISKDGVTWETCGPVVTKFDADKNPYFAVLMPDQDDYYVKFTVNTPKYSTDDSLTLKAGTIVVETTRDSADNHEVNYGDNWTSTLKVIHIDTGVVETTAVTADNQTADENASSVPIILAMHDATNESITQVIITNPPAAGAGTIWYDGHKLTVQDGKIIISCSLEEPFDTSKLSFVPAPYWSGEYTPSYIVTVTDNASGAHDDFTGSLSIIINAVADLGTDLEAENKYADNTSAVGAGAEVTFTVSANFVDTDGSEQHYILVEQLAGWGNPKGYLVIPITDTDTGTVKYYFQIEVDSRLSDPSIEITLSTPAGITEDTRLTLNVGNMVVDSNGIASDTKYSVDDAQINISIGVVDSSLNPVSDGALIAGSDEKVILAFGLAEGEGGRDHNDTLLSITITLPAQGGQIFCNGVLLSQSDGKVTFDYDSTAEYSFKPAEGKAGEMILNYSALVKDNASGVVDTLSGSSKVIVENYAPEPTESTVSFDASSELFLPVLSGLVEFTDQNPGDEVSVHRVVVGGQSYSFEDGSDTLSVAGAHGTLLIHKDGSYSYELAEGSHSNETEQFQVVGIDKYGAESQHADGSANLTINIGNVIVGGDGHDVIHAGHADSVIYGGDGNDTIYGGDGHDVIYGGDGDDVIHAGLGGSVIHGGDGNDLLIAGPGDDIFFGGAGEDTFQWNKDGLGGTDTIKDFNIAEGDKIDLHGLFSDTNKSLDDLFRNFQSGNADNDRLEVKLSGTDALELTIHSDGNPSQTIIVHGFDTDGTTSLGQAYGNADDAEKLALLQQIINVSS